MVIPPSSECPEALRHGPADSAGRCPWCKKQVDAPRTKPKNDSSHTTDFWYDRDDRPIYHDNDQDQTDLARSYDEMYNPDFGGRKYDR